MREYVSVFHGDLCGQAALINAPKYSLPGLRENGHKDDLLHIRSRHGEA